MKTRVLLAAGVGIAAIAVTVGGFLTYSKIQYGRWSLSLHWGRTPITLNADCISIEDPAKNDFGCGALSCAQRAFKSAAIHNTNQEAIGNLGRCLKPRGQTAMLVGHGWPGRVDTGGPSPALDDQILSFQNSSWKPIVSSEVAPKKPSMMTFVSCSTGRETDKGVKFLNEFATASSATTTRAPTSDILCSNGKMYFLGGQWQTFPPTVAPEKLKQENKGNLKAFQLRYGSSFGVDHYETVLTSQVSELLLRSAGREFRLEQTERDQLLDSLYPAKVFLDHGCPVAGKAGEITASFLLFNGKSDQRTFEVLTNGMLRDTSQRDINVFYRTSIPFENEWDQLLIQHLQEPK